MIHFFHRSHAKKPESGLFSDWIGYNTDDLRCSDWPNRRHPLVVVDFSLHFCLRNVSVKSKLQHAPPGQTPGHLTFLKIIVQIPPYPGENAVQNPHSRVH